MSADIGKDHGTQISQKTQKRKVLEEPVLLQMRDVEVKEQVQQILTYVQKELANIWKENYLKNMDIEKMQFKSAEDLLAELKREFGKSDNESAKVAKLKKIE